MATKLLIFSLCISASCASFAQKQYDKRMNCLEFKALKLSKEGRKTIEDAVSRFYGGAFRAKDVCYDATIPDGGSQRSGLFRGSLLNSHFPNFFFIKTPNDVSVIEADPNKQKSFVQSANEILDKYKSQLDSGSISKIRKYVAERAAEAKK